MATVKTVAEAKRYFGLPDNCPVVNIVMDILPANWDESQHADSFSVGEKKRKAG